MSVFFFPFCKVGGSWDPRTQSGSLTKGHDIVQPRLFYSLWMHPDKAHGLYILVFSNARHSHSICTDVSFSASHLPHEEIYTLQVEMRLVRSPTNILQYFLSSLLMNWQYLSVGSSRHGWLVSYLPQALHFVCFLFQCQSWIPTLCNKVSDTSRIAR